MTNLLILLSDVLGGHRLTESEAVLLLNTRDRDALRIASAADEMRERRTGNVVTYVRNQNLHVTNICKNLCGFCGFGRSADDQGAYCNDKAAIQEKARLALKRGVTEICLLTGYIPIFQLTRTAIYFHGCLKQDRILHLHAFSPDEVSHAASASNISQC